MTDLDLLYARLLQLGFIVVKQANEAADRSWIQAELDMLHNLPTLIGEENADRHRYYWDQERSHYLDWVSQSGNDDANSRMRTYYEPIWAEMEPMIASLLDTETRRTSA